MTTYYPINHRGAIYPRRKARTLVEKIAKAIYETKYKDSEFERLHPRRLMRKQRILEAQAVISVLKKWKGSIP